MIIGVVNDAEKIRVFLVNSKSFVHLNDTDFWTRYM